MREFRLPEAKELGALTNALTEVAETPSLVQPMVAREGCVERLRACHVQHDHDDVIVSTLHVHLDHRNCLEVLVVRGKAGVVKRIADELIAAKGVKHGKLTITTSGKDLPS